MPYITDPLPKDKHPRIKENELRAELMATGKNYEP